MSTILDALGRARGRSTPHSSANAARTDAVLETLGYSRRRSPSRVEKLVRLLTLVAAGAIVVVLLWAAIVWFKQSSAHNSTAAPPVASPTVSASIAKPRVPPTASPVAPPHPAALTQLNPPVPVVAVKPSLVASKPQSSAATRTSPQVEPARGDLMVRASQRVDTPAGPPQPPAASPSRTLSRAGSPEASSDADHFKLALYYQRTGDFENALIQYRDVLQRDPLHIEAHNNLGLLYRDKGLLDEAVKEFQAAIAIDERYVKGHNNLGVALLTQHKSEAAAAEFRTALTLDPRNVESLVNLALAEKDSGLREDARASLKRAIELDARNAEAHYNLALLSDELGDRPQALVHYRAFLQYGGITHPELASGVSKRIETIGR